MNHMTTATIPRRPRPVRAVGRDAGAVVGTLDIEDPRENAFDQSVVVSWLVR
jgi:hypothetical protein